MTKRIKPYEPCDHCGSRELTFSLVRGHACVDCIAKGLVLPSEMDLGDALLLGPDVWRLSGWYPYLLARLRSERRRASAKGA